MTRILVVDDEVSIRELVHYNLEKAGFKVECQGNGLKALQRILIDPPALVILDIMLPGMDGFEVCRQLRQNEKTRNLPVIMLSAMSEEIDRVVGLEIGADDYLTKPFSPRELLARVKSLLRRSQGGALSVLETAAPAAAPAAAQNFGDQASAFSSLPAPETSAGLIVRGRLKIDTDRFEAFLDNELLELTLKQYQLLVHLAANPGKVFSREYLLEKIWGYEIAGDTRTVDVHIRHLRQKIESDPSRPELIETIRGVGYRFKG